MILKLILLLIVYSTSGCSFFHIKSQEDSAKYVCSEVLDSFYKMSKQERIAAFSNKDVEEKYVIYICSNQEIHPPDTSLALIFSRDGESIVEFLKEKLKSAYGSVTIFNIILIFQFMSYDNSYNVRDDTKLVMVIESAISRVNDTFWKSMCEQSLNEIRNPMKPICPLKILYK